VTGGALRIVVIGGELWYLARFRGPLLRAMVRAGHEVWVATPDAPPPAPTPLERIGASYRRVSLDRTGMSPVRDLRDGRALTTWLRDLRPDVAFAYGAKPIAVGLAAAARAGVGRRYAMLAGLGYAFVRDGRRSPARALARAAQLILYRRAFAGCRRVVFHNAEDRDALVARGVLPLERTVIVDGSGIDTEAFAFHPPPVRPPRFLFVGRLLRSKGVEELAAAAASLRRAVPEAEVHLVGALDRNPDRLDVDELERAAGRGDVVLHGRVDDVRPHLRAASVFVLPSYREGLPRSALEALATGRACIVADVAGCREVVRPGRHGALVPARDAEALAQTMIAYAHDPERVRREGAAAREEAERRFAVDIVTDAMLEALELTRGG
jgi:glycosyltransferase involved in cell wall biosynthesis